VSDSVYPLKKDGTPDKRYKGINKSGKLKNPNYKNVRAPQGKHWCTEHKQYEPIENFGKNSRKVKGLSNRCREGQREYRKRYEEQYGKRQHNSKTLRVSVPMHKKITTYCKTFDASIFQVSNAAFEFYLKYACRYPGCTNPKGKRFDRCHEHVNAIRLQSEDKL